jgi:hypothetical protein
VNHDRYVLSTLQGKLKMSNRQLEEIQEEQAHIEIAEKIGITYEELCQLDCDIDTNESSDGLIYEHIITFSEDSPKEILDKIVGLENGNSVRVQLSESDS